MTQEPEPTDYTKVETPGWYQGLDQLYKRRGWRLGSSIYGLLMSITLTLTGTVLAIAVTPWIWSLLAVGVAGVVLFTWRLATIRRHPW